MLVWKDATQSKPNCGDRVVLKIRDNHVPVIGYFACWGGVNKWTACTTNLTCACDRIEDYFPSEDVTHYAEIGELPE